MTEKEWSDTEIIQRFAEQSTRQKAFNHLIRKYQVRLYWHIRRMVISHADTDDVLQNSLIKIWHALPNFRGDAALYTWIYRITTNETLSFLRNKQRVNFYAWEDTDNDFACNLADDPYFDGSKLQQRLQNYIMQLPNKQRLVFNLKYFDEMKYDEIAAITGGSVGSLKASFHHAVTKIKQLMRNDLI
ncbi:RNA polymerase sigma factor [Marinilabiliaceae bacterium JC017]|nr:RNA polymerase sigma factor [Marinilabiliaceae bacterium JC017]